MKELMNSFAGKLTRFAIEATIGTVASIFAIKHGKELLFEKVEVQEVTDDLEEVL
jgi:hypothetical protein